MNTQSQFFKQKRLSLGKNTKRVFHCQLNNNESIRVLIEHEESWSDRVIKCLREYIIRDRMKHFGNTDIDRTKLYNGIEPFNGMVIEPLAKF